MLWSCWTLVQRASLGVITCHRIPSACKLDCKQCTYLQTHAITFLLLWAGGSSTLSTEALHLLWRNQSWNIWNTEYHKLKTLRKMEVKERVQGQPKKWHLISAKHMRNNEHTAYCRELIWVYASLVPVTIFASAWPRPSPICDPAVTIWVSPGKLCPTR